MAVTLPTFAQRSWRVLARLRAFVGAMGLLVALIAALQMALVQAAGSPQGVQWLGAGDAPVGLRLRLSADTVPFGASGAGNFSQAPPLLMQCSVQAPPRPDRADAQLSTHISRARWVNAREWQWDFGEPLRGGQRCTVGVNPAFRTVTGQALSAQVLGPGNTLHVPGPVVVQTWPERYEPIDEAQIIVLRTNAPVSPQSVQAHASCRTSDLGEAAAVRWVDGRERERAIAAQGIDPRSAEGRALVAVACARRLNPDARATLIWGAGVQTAQGMALGTTQRFEWTVRAPFTAQLRCQRESARAGCLPIAPVDVHFSAPVPWSAAAQMRLMPTPEGAQSSRAAPKTAPATPIPLDAYGEPVDADVWAAQIEKSQKNQSAQTLTVAGVRFAAPLAENSNYRIALPQDFTDDAGRTLANARAWPLPLRTGSMPVLARFANDRFGVIERASAAPGRDDTPALLPITVRNIEPMVHRAAGDDKRPTAQVRNLLVRDDADIISWWGRLDALRGHVSRDVVRRHLGASAHKQLPVPRNKDDRFVDSRSLSLLDDVAGVQTLALPMGASGHKAQRDFEVLGLPLAQAGFHVVELQSPALGARLLADAASDGSRSMFVRTAALVTDLAVHVKTSPRGALVWVTRLSTAQPVQGAQVQVSGCDGTVAAQGHTDAQGTLSLPELPARGPSCSGHSASSQWFVSARTSGWGSGGDMAFAWSDWNDGIEPWRFNLPRVYDWGGDGSAWRAHSVLDRSLVRAGDVVSMKHYLRVQDMHGLRLPDAWPRWVSITHVGSGQRWVQPIAWQATASGSRNADSRFALPTHAKLGSYSVALHFTHPDTGEAGSDAADAVDAQRLPAELTSASFEVQAFRTPVFRGDIAVVSAQVQTAADGTLIAPAQADHASTWTIPLAAQLHYFNGGAAAGQSVQVSASVEPAAAPHFAQWPAFDFSPHADLAEKRPLHQSAMSGGNAPHTSAEDGPDAGEYLELRPTPSHGSGTRLVADKITATLDAQGQARVDLPHIPTPTVPTLLTAQMRFADPSGEIHTLHTQRTLWPAAATVGIGGAGSGWVGQRLPLSLLAVDAAGRAQAGLTVSARATLVRTFSTRHRLVGGFYSYHNERHEQDLGAVCSGRTNAQGQLHCHFTPSASGEVQIIATVTDAAGRASHSATTLWVSAPGQPLWFGGHDHDRMDLIAEPPTEQATPPRWRVGDIARIQVQMPFQRASALLTVEREGILHREVIELSADDPTVKLRIQPGWGPNVFVSVLALRARVFEVPWYSFFTWGYRAPRLWWDAFWGTGDAYAAPTAMVDLSKPAMRLGVTELAIDDPDTVLTLTLRAEAATLRPRETARVHIQAQRADGSPAAGASVAIAAVDDALLALMPNLTWDLHRHLWQRSAWGVETASAQMHVVGRRHFGLKAAAPGGGGGDAATQRELLDTLLTWQPHVTLDDQGRASVAVPMNDALSSFTVVAIADDGPSRFGQARTVLRTTQDIQIISALPPVVREGDALHASATVRNTTDAPQRLRVYAHMGAVQLAAQDITLAAQSSANVAWPVTIPTIAQVLQTPALADPNDPTLLRPTSEKVDLGRGQPLNATSDASASASNNAASNDAAPDIQQPEAALVWTISAQPLDAPSAAGNPTAPRGDSLRITQRLLTPTPSTVVQSQLLQIPPEGLRQSVAAPQGALPHRGGLRLTLASRIAGGEAGPPGLRSWWQRYPHRCLEQSTARAIGLGDLALWQQWMEQLPAYLDQHGLAHYFPPSHDGHMGSVTLTAHLLRVDAILGANDPRWALPTSARERMLSGLAHFVAGRHDSAASGRDRSSQTLAAIAALAVHGRARADMLEGLTLSPATWPTHAVLDWLDILQALPALPHRLEHIAQARAHIAQRMRSAGSLRVFDPVLTAAVDDASWLHMQNADTHQARWLLHTIDQPHLDDERPAVLAGLLAAQQGGTWASTSANTWATLALRAFSQRYERQTVSGHTQARLGAATQSVTWPEAPTTTAGEGSQSPDTLLRPTGSKVDLGRGQPAQPQTTFTLPWPPTSSGASSELILDHQGSGQPWVAIQAIAAMAHTPTQTPPQSAGYRIQKTIERIANDGSVLASATPLQRGDIVRVRLTVHADASRNWVALSDPIPPGATILGSGLARNDEAIATRAADVQHSDGDNGDGDAPAFIERDHDSLRAYWSHVDAGQTLVQTYYLRLNAAGTFALPPTRVEALYDPATFGQHPNASWAIQPEPAP